MVEIKIVETPGKIPISVIGTSIEHCIDILIDKGIIDERTFTRRRGHIGNLTGKMGKDIYLKRPI